MSKQEFDAEKYYMHGVLIFDSDIEKYGMCLEDPEKECHDSCKKFMTRKCNGAVLIRQAGGKTWQSRGWYKVRKEEGSME
uniref:Uncharacterized protein n=1 Tax=viral metagenome TaxID=1070528 RepID=A0A6M3X621_9ZZZZ